MNLTSNPIDNFEDDLIGIGDKANYMARLISNTTDSSLRIGLFGEWGSGKSSLLRIVEKDIFKNEKYKDEAYKFVWFNPWLFSSEDDLINGFNTEVFINFNEKLESISEPDSGVRKTLGYVKKLVDSDTLDKFGFGQVNSVVNVISNVFKNIAYSKERIQTLISKSEERVVFIVEDLDRCDPKILPAFLLYLRELLDIPSVTTIFITEYEAITDSLSSNARFSFIEKIYDIPIHLSYSKKSLASDFILKYKDNPFDSSIIEKHKELLPVNPRFLKKFCKQLQLLKPEIERYKKDEIRLESLYLIQLLKFRFPTFFEFLLQNEAVLREIKTSGEKRGFYDNLSDKEKSENLEKSIENEVFDKMSNDIREKNNIVKILESIWIKSNSFPSQDIISYGEFLEKQIGITQKELEGFYSDNVDNLTVDKLKELKRAKNFSNLEILNILIYLRRLNLEKYFDSIKKEDGDNLLGKIQDIMNLVGLYVNDAETEFEFSDAQFGALCEAIRGWSEVLKVRENEEDEHINNIVSKNYELLDLFFNNGKKLDSIVSKAKGVIDHHRIFKAENEFIGYLMKKIEGNEKTVEDEFLNKVIETKCEILCNTDEMSHYSSYLDEKVFVKLLDRLDALDDSLYSEVVFAYFENWRTDRSYVLNYFTHYPQFIQKYSYSLRKLWGKVDREKLTSWAKVKAIEIDKQLDTVFPLQSENEKS